MLSGDNGLLKRATDAKTETEKGQEKEIVALAYNSALAKKVSNGDSTAVTSGDLNTELTNQGASADGSDPITVTFTNSKRQYTINSSGTIEYAGIQSREETVTPTDIYATVCANGTLVFSNNQKAIEDYIEENETELADEYSIENITDSVFYIGDSPEESNLPKWFQNTNITNVDFLNKVVPKNTALWFAALSNLTTIGHISNLYTNNVTSMDSMFRYCSSITELNLSNFNTSNVSNMNGIFDGCSNLQTLTLSDKFDTSNITNMSYMFQGCSKLTTLDLSNFNTRNVTDMSSMFMGCSSLTSININNFNTSNVIYLNEMFYDCSNLSSLNLSSFNTSNVISMHAMFGNCSNITSLDLSNFNTGKVVYFGHMFDSMDKLLTIYASNNFTTTVATDSEDMFYGCSSLVGGNGTTYNFSNRDATYAHVDGGTTNPGYFTAK